MVFRLSLVLLSAGLALLATNAPAADSTTSAISPRQGPHVLPPAAHGVGRLVPDIAFTDLEGRAGLLSDFRSSRLLVIALTSTTCPVTKKYAPALARLAQEFAAQNVAFLCIAPTATDSADDLRAVARETARPGRTVHDRDQRLAAALGAQTTAEVFVLDAARTLLYRGALDDQYGLGYSLDQPRQTFLINAIEARLAGRPRPCDQGRGPSGRPTAAVRPSPRPDWPADRNRVTARSPVARWVGRSSALVPRRACVRQYPRGGAGSRADGKSASVPRRAALVYLVPAALGCRRCGRHPLAGRESVRVSTPWRVGAYLVWWPRLHSCPPRETLRRAELRADA